MQFVYPSFLYALGLIAIPIVIHLFNLVRPKKVIFSNISFLKEVDLKSSRKVKLKHILILISRILFITFLVLLFAQPFISDGNVISENDSPTVCIYIDNSNSMGVIENDESLLNSALKQAALVIDKYPRNTKFQLLDNDFKPNSLFLHKKEKIKDYITEIDFSNQSKTAAEIYARQINAIKKETSGQKQIIWFSDLQKSTFGNLSDIEKDTSVEHLVFKVNKIEANNLSIDSVYLESPFIKKEESNTLYVSVENSGNEEVSDVLVKLKLGEREVSQTNVSIKPKASEIVKLNFEIEQDGEHLAAVEIEDNTLNFDNTHRLVLNAENAIKILSISDSSESNYRKIYANEPSFDFEHSNVKDIPFGELSNFNLIILEELKNIPASLISELLKYKNNNVLLVPNANFDKENYARFSTTFGFNTSLVQKEKLQLSFPDLNNPFFSNMFNKKDNKVKMPFMNPLFKLSSIVNSLLTFTNGAKAIVRGGSNNQIFICTSAFTSPSSDFLNHSFIVPFMYRLAMESSNANKVMYYTINNNMKTVFMNSDSIKGVFNFVNQEVNITPEQFLSGNKLKFRIDETMKFGFYDLKNKSKTVKKIAFNPTLKEGDLEGLDSKSIDLFNDKKIESGTNAASFISEINNGIPLWRYCLYLALLFLLIEILLIRLYKA